MNYVYIIYSQRLNKYYIGETVDVNKRLDEHNSKFYSSAFTKATKDWELYLTIPCENRVVARSIERHIKNMKSKRYIENLRKYPEMIETLLKTY